LVLDPQKMTVDHLHAIVSSFTPTSESCRVDWIKNPLMQSWLMAVTLQPNDFILHLEDQVDFLNSLSETLEDDEPVLDINRHIQWTLTHHLFVDALVADANKQMNTKFSRFLNHCLADTVAIGASPLVGPVDDIFSLGVCLCFRHPSVKSWIEEHGFGMFVTAPIKSLPSSVRSLASATVSPTKDRPPVPLTTTKATASPPGSPSPHVSPSPTQMFGACRAPGDDSTPSKPWFGLVNLLTV